MAETRSNCDAQRPALECSPKAWRKKLRNIKNYSDLTCAVQREIHRALGYQRAWIYLLGHNDKEHVQLITDQGVVLLERDDPWAEQMLVAEDPIVVDDACTDPKRCAEVFDSLRSRTIIGIPIHHGDQRIGALCTGSFDNEGVMVPTEANLKMLISLACSVGIVISQIQFAKERQNLERQLLHAQKLESLGVLAGGVAHDFNNILASILGNTDLAMRALSPTHEVFTRLSEIHKASQLAADLANQMLVYSGKGKFLEEVFDINHRVHEILRLLETGISKQAIFTMDLGENLPPILGEPTQFRQVVMNLVTNASDALGGECGDVKLRTWVENISKSQTHVSCFGEDLAPGQYVGLMVSDTGCGMDEETCSRLFDPFFTTKYTGRGLGMAAVLGIVRAYQGDIKVDSEVGCGTTFTLLFPASDQPRPNAFERPKLMTPMGSGTILVIDDEPIVRTIVKSILDEYGFKTILTTCGSEAMEALRQHDITAVLLDMTMPQEHGTEVLHLLRKVQTNIPVVLSSGYSEEQVVEQIDARTLFLKKPYLPGDLIEKLLLAAR